MKSIIGYSFTDSPANYLTERGFSFQRNDSKSAEGYIDFVCTFAAKSFYASFVIREIQDEIKYLQINKMKEFAPFEIDNYEIRFEMTSSSVIALDVLSEKMEDGELKDYFRIKKKHPLWAIHLKTADFSNFCSLVKPDHFYLFKNQKAIVIHMGESCFDLVIT